MLLARDGSSPETESKGELLTASLDWDRVMQLIREHEILPLVYCNLKRLGFSGVPESARAELTSLFQRNALRNELLKEELTRALSQLADAQVPAIPLKGIPLAESLYGDAALRVCADIDILVPPQKFEAAFRALSTLGYQAGFTQPQLVTLTARYGKDCGLMRQDSSIWYPLQLHAGLIWGGPTERSLSKEIWAEAHATTFHGAPAWALSREWELLYLTIHAARHGLSPLKFVVDIDRICRRQDVNWETVQQTAARLGWGQTVQSTLSACATLLETPIPPAVQATEVPKQPQSTTVSGTRQKAIATLLPHTEPSSLQILKETLFSIGLLPSSWQKLRFIAARAFIPTTADCRLLRLPSSLFFLYYGWRPLRLIVTMTGWLVSYAAYSGGEERS